VPFAAFRAEFSCQRGKDSVNKAGEPISGTRPVSRN